MEVGQRIKDLREQKQLSQAVVEQRTGLLRCHISRIENGHIVPGLETLDKLAAALDVPLYAFFYDGSKPPQHADSLKQKNSRDAIAESGKDGRVFAQFRRLLGRVSDSDRKLLLSLLQKMAARPGRKELAA